MPYQTIYNPATKQILSIDLGASDAYQRIVSYYQQGWTAPPAGTPIPPPSAGITGGTTSGGTVTLPGYYAPAGGGEHVAYLPGQTLPTGAVIVIPPKTIQVKGPSLPPNIEGITPEGNIVLPSGQVVAPSMPNAPSILDPFKSGDSYNLMDIVQRGTPGQILMAKQTWPDQDWNYLSYANRPIWDISTKEGWAAWDKLSKEKQQLFRPVMDVTIDQYAQMTDRQKLNVKSIVAKEVSPEVYKQLGTGTKPYATPDMNLATTPMKVASISRTIGVTLMGMVPFVSFAATAMEWNKMSPTMRGLSLGLDTLIVLPIFGITGPAIGTIYRSKGEFGQLVKAAKVSGKAFNKAQEATAALENLQKIGALRTSGTRPNIAAVTKWRGYVQSTVLDSAKADQKFVASLASLKKVNIKNLKLIEKEARMPGFADAIKDVNKYSKQLDKQWSGFGAKWGETGAASKLGDPILQRDVAQRYLSEYNRVVSTRKNLQDALHRVSQTTREGARLNPALMRAEEKLPMWSQQGRGWRKGPQALVPRVSPRLDAKVAELTKQANKLQIAVARVERIDPEIAAGLKSKLRTVLQKVDALSGPKLDYWTGRIKRLRIPDDPTKTSTAVDKFLKGLGDDTDKAIDKDYSQLLKDTKDAAKKQDDYLRWKAKDIAEGHPWELEKGTKTATKVKTEGKTKATEGAQEPQAKTTRPKTAGTKEAPKVESKVAPKEKAATEQVAKTKIEEEPKFGMKPKPKIRLAPSIIPGEVRGRQTYSQIAKQYGQQAVEDAIGKPISNLATTSQVKTAQEVNQQYQNSLLKSVQSAINVWNSTYNQTGNKNEANVKAQEAAQTQTQTETNLAVKTAVITAVNTMIKNRIIQPRGIKPIKPKSIKLLPILLPGANPGSHKKILSGTVAWKQGLFYKVAVIQNRRLVVLTTKEKPEGVPIVKGIKSAFKTLTRKGAYFPPEAKYDMGIMDVKITKKGKQIRFVRDVKRKTRGNYIKGEPELIVKS